MLFYLGLPLVSVLVCLFLTRNLPWSDPDSELVSTRAVSFMVTAVASLCTGVLVAGTINSSIPTYTVEVKRLDLVTFRETAGANGDFFLGCGSVGEIDYYFYYYRSGGGYKRDKIEVSSSITIYEGDDADPAIVWCTEKFSNRATGLLFGLCDNMPYHRTVNIYIPTGSLRREFSIGGGPGE